MRAAVTQPVRHTRRRTKLGGGAGIQRSQIDERKRVAVCVERSHQGRGHCCNCAWGRYHNLVPLPTPRCHTGTFLGRPFTTASSKFVARGSGRAVTRVIAQTCRSTTLCRRKCCSTLFGTHHAVRGSTKRSSLFGIRRKPSVEHPHQTRTVVHDAGAGHCFRFLARSGCEGCISSLYLSAMHSWRT